VRQAQIFVAVLGASNYTYAEATFSQALPDWISAHVRALEFFGGTPELIVCDNLKAGVSLACRYEPDLNATYSEFAAHYGLAVVPARPYKPRDKAKVEVGVQVVERWILARLRNLSFFSLAELNDAIKEMISDLNQRSFKRLPGSRASQFGLLDQPALGPLPAQAYEYAEWQAKRVGLDYHIEVEGHYYSVPHALLRQRVEVRLTAKLIEVYYRGKRIASHLRSQQVGAASTLFDHMPVAHQKHQSWTPAGLRRWASEVGPQTAALVSRLLDSKPHPEQGYRSCLGLIALAREYGLVRLEAACQRALRIGSPSRQSVADILKSGLDRLPVESPDESLPQTSSHANVRGAAYYQMEESLP
jgi:transposase